MSKLYDLLHTMIGKINASVKTVNGVTPDENGNVKVEGGGVTDYTKLENKPTETIGGDTLTWDGNTEGLVCIPLGIPFYKVSDAVITVEDLANGATFIQSDGEQFTCTAEEVGSLDGIGVAFLDVVLSLSEVDSATVGFPAGTYLASMNGYYVASLTIPGYTGFTKEVLKPEALPEHGHKWNDIEDKPFGDVDTVYVDEQIAFSGGEGVASAWQGELVVGETYTVTFDGTSYQCKTTSSDYGPVFGNLSKIGIGDDTGEPFWGGYMGGNLILCIDDTAEVSHTVKITGTAIDKLEQKYVDCQTVFYIGFDAYLYEDSDCTIKATKADVRSAVKAGPIAIHCLSSVGVGCLLLPVCINLETYDYAVVLCIEWTGESNTETKIYYTAEYTAT